MMQNATFHREGHKFKTKNHFKRADFSPKTIRTMMLKNLNSKVLPVVVYEFNNKDPLQKDPL